MKQIIKKSVQAIIYGLYCVFTPRFFKFLNLKMNQLYSVWKSNEFNQIGSAFIQYPLYLEGGKNITIGKNFSCDQRLRLDAINEFLGDKFDPVIVIGNNVSIQKDCHIGCINQVVIGDGVLLASKVFISDHSHGEITSEAIAVAPSQRKLYSKGPIIIEDNVWLGEGVVVLPGVTIGENSIIGSNAVVTKSIPKNSVAGGNPAQIIREIK